MNDHAFLTELKDTALIAMLHSTATTMLDIEQRKLKLDDAAIRRVADNANAMADEVERRGIQKLAVVPPTSSLGKRLQKRGIK